MDGFLLLESGGVTSLVFQLGQPAGTKYVSPAGVDLPGSGSLAQPYLTLNYAVGQLAAGQTLYVRAGTYAEKLVDVIPSGISWARPTTIAAYPGEVAIIRPPASATRAVQLSQGQHHIQLLNLVLDGVNASKAPSTRSDGVKLTYASSGTGVHHVRLSGCEIKNWAGNGVLLTQDPATNNLVHHHEILNCRIHDNGIPLAAPNAGAGHGVYIESSDNLVDGCTIYNNGEWGVHLFRSPAAASDGQGINVSRNTVRNNVVYNNGYGLHSGGAAANGWGIICSTGQNNLIYNNVVYKNKGGGIQGTSNDSALGKCTGARVYYNTVFYNNVTLQGNHGLEWDSSTTTSDLRGNLCYHNSEDFFRSPGSTGTTEDYNLLGDNGSTAAAIHDLHSQNPRLNAPFQGDFRLLAGSPALSAGVDIAAVPSDILGRPRPAGQYTIGAYQDVAVHTAASYYVDPATGSDANAGTLAAPFGTLNYAVSGLVGGDTLFLRAGTYVEWLNDAIPPGLDDTHRVTLQAYPGETAVLRPPASASHAVFIRQPYIVLDGLEIDGTDLTDTTANGVRVSYKTDGSLYGHHVRVQNCTIHHCPDFGVRVRQDDTVGALTVGNEVLSNTIHDCGVTGTAAVGGGVCLASNGNTVSGNTIRDNCAEGVWIAYGSGANVLGASSNTISRNRITGNGFGTNALAVALNAYGINCSNGASNLVQNNLVYANTGGGIEVGTGADAAAVRFNAVYNNGSLNHGIDVDGGLNKATNAVVRNNALHGNSQGDLFVSLTSTGSAEDYNVYGTRGGIAQGAHSVVGDPSWTSAAGGDFTLQGGSPCHDAGLTTAGVTVDFAGTTRGSPPDVGAYED